jgi:hypothetical protein
MAWRNPNLHERVLDPRQAREYIEEFPWREHGFPEGKPYSFLSHGVRYRTMDLTDNEAVACALAILLDFALDMAMQERMRVEFEI